MTQPRQKPASPLKARFINAIARIQETRTTAANKMGRRKYKNETLTIRQAMHKNIALNCHLDLVKRVIAEENKHRIAKLIKERDATFRKMKTIREVFPYDMDQLNEVHRLRASRRHHIFMHIVNCYMLQQERNNKMWNSLQEIQALPPAPHRPVDMSEHIRFVQDKFPKTCSFATEHGWQYSHNPAADMYTYGRACHDALCFEARTKTIGHLTGVFPAEEPIRFNPNSEHAVTMSLPTLLNCRTMSTLAANPFHLTEKRQTSLPVGAVASRHGVNAVNSTSRLTPIESTCGSLESPMMEKRQSIRRRSTLPKI
ncbi:hypothetical protein LSAT2_029279 [Lamellibrachia satsuma]|nr:hypothetical protein LSAT2_029279 [Lamellibrachia satsuma]